MIGVDNDQIAGGEGIIAKEEATKTSRMAKLTNVMTTRGTFSRRNICPPNPHESPHFQMTP